MLVSDTPNLAWAPIFSKLVDHLPFLQQRPNDYGIPVAVEVTYVQDNFLTSDVLNEMVQLHPMKTLKSNIFYDISINTVNHCKKVC